MNKENNQPENWEERLYFEFPWLKLQSFGKVNAKNPKKDSVKAILLTELMNYEGKKMVNFIRQLLKSQRAEILEEVEGALPKEWGDFNNHKCNCNLCWAFNKCLRQIKEKLKGLK